MLPGLRRAGIVSHYPDPVWARLLAAVVQHLQVLERSGLVHTEKAGRVRTCRMESAGLTVVEQWIDDRRSSWERRFDQLGELLDAEDDS